jgi:hypothetical protein
MQVIVGLIVAQLAIFGLGPWLHRHLARGGILPGVWNRVWEVIARFRRAPRWDPGEQEIYRAPLLKVTAYTIDRHVQIQRSSICEVTDRRVMARDYRGRMVQLAAGDIRTVRAYRTYDRADGFTYAVVLERVGSTVHGPEGDLLLQCASQQESLALAAAIEEIAAPVSWKWKI